MTRSSKNHTVEATPRILNRTLYTHTSTHTTQGVAFGPPLPVSVPLAAAVTGAWGGFALGGKAGRRSRGVARAGLRARPGSTTTAGSQGVQRQWTPEITGL